MDEDGSLAGRTSHAGVQLMIASTHAMDKIFHGWVRPCENWRAQLAPMKYKL